MSNLAKQMVCMGLAVLTLVVLGYNEFAALWAALYLLMRGCLALRWEK
jgi:hypothetical protein